MPSYSDAEMRAIMGRALQIDTGRADHFTPEQLRSIAAELGISTQALEVAMYEADSKHRGLAGVVPAPARMSGWAKGVAAALVTLVLVAGAFAVMRTVAPQPRIVAAPADQAISGATAPARAVPVQPAPGPGPGTVTKKLPRATTKKQF